MRKKHKSTASSYALKSPFRYSTEYQNWTQAFKDGKPSEVAYWGQQHSKRFAPAFMKSEEARGVHFLNKHHQKVGGSFL